MGVDVRCEGTWQGIRKGLNSMEGVDMADADRGLLDKESMGRLKVEGLWFNEKNIWLDGYSFKNCRFDKCNIFVFTNNFDIEDCFIDDSNNIWPMGEVTQSVKLWNLRHPSMRGRDPYYEADRNENGNVTIKLHKN